MSETFLNPPVPEWFSRLFYLTRIRIAAEKKIVDEKRYFDVMTADPIEEVRRRAVCRLMDQALLRQAAERDPKETVRAEAAKRLITRLTLPATIKEMTGVCPREAGGMSLTENYIPKPHTQAKAAQPCNPAFLCNDQEPQKEPQGGGKGTGSGDAVGPRGLPDAAGIPDFCDR